MVTQQVTQEVENRQEVEPGYETSIHDSSGVLPPDRLHLPKVPQPLQTVPPAGDQMFKHVSPWVTLHTQAAIDASSHNTHD